MYEVSQLEIFPDELFLELFSYIPPVELCSVWHGFNRRLNAILRSVRISFDLIENTNENHRVLNCFSSQIIYIHLRLPSTTLDLKQFSNLRSLIIDTELTEEQIECIQPTILPHLRRLTFTEAWKGKERLKDVVFNQIYSKQWIKVYHLPSIPNYLLHKPFDLPHIQTMIFDRLTPCAINLVLSLLTTLRRLKVTMVPSIPDDHLSRMPSYDQPYQQKYLIDLHVTINMWNKLGELYPLLSHLSSLRYLYVACDSLAINDFQELAVELNTRVPWLERLNCSFRQTCIDNMKELHWMSPLFTRMICRKIEWTGGWHYYCVTTENL